MVRSDFHRGGESRKGDESNVVVVKLGLELELPTARGEDDEQTCEKSSTQANVQSVNAIVISLFVVLLQTENEHSEHE